MASENETSFWLLLKRSRIDYVIICIAFLLVASNQVFETTNLGPSGTIEVSDGSTIPQDTNYTLTSVSSSSFSSAIIFNESIQEHFLYQKIAVDAISRVICNITLQSSTDNNPVDIYMEFGHYETQVDAIAGILSTTYSIEPDMENVYFLEEYWIVWCHIRITSEVKLDLQNIVIWAEFDVPVTPVVLDYRTTDGHDLFDNRYTRLMRTDNPIMNIERISDESANFVNIEFQNYTLYLKPGNYTFMAQWGSSYIDVQEFNITLTEDTTIHCLVHMRVVRINLSFNTDFPLLLLSIDRDSYPTYEIFFHESEIPDYVYIPPYSNFDIEIGVITPFSRHSSGRTDIYVETRISSNSTHNFNVDIFLPYVNIAGIIFTPQDFIQIVLALFLFFLITVRIFTYLHSKKPRTSWKDPRLIPIIIFGVIACLPWYGGTHVLSSYPQYPLQIASLGVFPLMGCWIESSSAFLIIPPNGLFWALTSMIFFWIPLLLANYYTTPPSNISNNYASAILLFSPFILASIIHWNLNEMFAFTLQYCLPIFLILVPVAWFLCVIVLPFLGFYNYGPNYNQLSFDVKLSPQIADPEITPSPKESEPEPYCTEAQKTLELVLVFLLSAILIVPTSITKVFSLSGADYVLYSQYIVSPINAIEKLSMILLDVGGISTLFIIGIPIYYLFALGLASTIGMRTRPGLSGILIIIWIVLPFIFLNTLYGVYYHYYLQIDWVMISLPYYLLSIITILKIREYVRNEIKLKTLVAWILIPVLAIIPGVLILSWFSSLQIAASSYYITTWTPLPLFSILVFIVIWPLKKWIPWIHQRSKVYSDDGEVLQPENVAGNP